MDYVGLGYAKIMGVVRTKNDICARVFEEEVWRGFVQDKHVGGWVEKRLDVQYYHGLVLNTANLVAPSSLMQATNSSWPIEHATWAQQSTFRGHLR